MSKRMNEEKNTVESEVHYSWIGYPSNAPAEDREERTITLGGDSVFLNAEVVTFEDGSMALKLLSNGIPNKLGLTKFVESVSAIVQHDYLESQKEQRDK